MGNYTTERKFVTDLVLEAGETLKRYFNSGEFTSRSKGGVDVITQADKEVDTFLLESIRRQFPACNILTEETAPDDYSSFRQLDNLWVIDPLDGTVNFSRHNPHFAISVGLVSKGVSQMGVVYLPIENKLYWAEADQDGAFLNDKPIKVSTTGDLKETVFCCDWGWNLETRMMLVKWLGRVNESVRQIKCMGSAVSDLASLADGSVESYLHSGLKPWDVAASALFIEKAGGKITTPSGGKWDIFNPEMLATNGVLHDQILELIK